MPGRLWSDPAPPRARLTTTTAGAPAAAPNAARRARLGGAGAAARAAACAALPVLAVLAAGCVRGTLPAREFYRLRPAPAAGLTSAPAAPRAADPSLPPLTVAPYETPGVYAGPELVYRVGDGRYGTYPSREWAVPLGAMLAALTADAVRGMDGGGPGVVQDGDAGRGAPGGRGLVWRGVVREFEEVDRDGAGPGPRVTTAVRLDARLVRAADDSVLWQGSAALERAVAPERQMTAVVAGLGETARQVVARLVREAAPAMRAAGAADAAQAARVARGPAPAGAPR